MQQQRFRRLAVFFGGVVLASSGLVMVACGTDNGDTPVPTPQIEAGKDGAGKDSSTTENEGGGQTDGGPGVDADCSKAPQLRAVPADGFFCPFQAKDAGAGGAGAGNCSTGQTCCSPGIADGGPFAGKFPPSYCAGGRSPDACENQDTANASDFQPGFFSNTWECQDKSNCAAGQICVLFTSTFAAADQKVNVGKDTKFVPASCNAQRSYQQGGTKCVAGPDEAPDQIKLCSPTDTVCGSGKTCKAFDANNRDLGGCLK